MPLQPETSPAGPTSTPPLSGSFREEFSGAARDLRATLTSALTAADALAGQPQELGRKLGIDKMLAWKVFKVVSHEDPYQWASQVPGRAGLAKVVKALRGQGVPSPIIEQLEGAADAFEAMVSRHAGDRTTLHAVISGLAPAAQPSLLLEARRLAFRGNSGTVGVAAEAQLSTFILAPNADDPDRADMVQLGGMTHFRRLRSDVAWPLFHRARWTGAGEAEVGGDPLDPDVEDRDGVPWMLQHCTRPLPEVQVIPGDRGVQYALAAGPIGLTGSVTCTYGSVMRSVGPAICIGDEDTSEFGCNLLTPVRRLQLDLLVADELGWTVSPEFTLVSRMHGDWVEPTSSVSANGIPCTETLTDLGRGLAGLSNPHLPDYVSLMSTAFERTGWDPSGFQGWRLSMEVPPIPATAMLSCLLRG